MPNHVTNKLEFVGEQERIDEILEAIKNDEAGIGSIDFNKIIPMPESLNITSGSVEHNSINAYLTAVNPYTPNYGLTKLNDFDYFTMINIDRASKFYQLIRYSYASGCDSFGCQPHSMWNNFPLIEQASRRLQNVVIENKDFEKLIRQYDRPVSFFYCDPPYYATEDYYNNVGFTEIDHIRLRDTLFDIQGKFMVSYNDCDFIRGLYEKTDIQIQSFTRINNIKQRYEGGSQYAEILIANYDMSERLRSIPEQLSFADTD